MAVSTRDDLAKRRWNRPIWVALIVVSGLMVGSLAYGYVLQGPHVLELMVDRLSGARTLQVQQTVTVEATEVDQDAVTVPELLRYAFPDRFRSDANYGQSQRILVSAKGKLLTVVDGRWRAGQASRYDGYKDLLLLHSRPMIHKALLAHGIDVGITSLGRFENQIFYVIGARYPDVSVSQVWVDKERFVPLRWIIVDPADATVRTVFVYQDWRPLEWRKGRFMWYPQQVNVYDGQRLIRRIAVTGIQAGVDLPNQLWDTAYLQSQFEPEPPTADTGQPEVQVDEMQEVIKSFQKKFEP